MENTVEKPKINCGIAKIEKKLKLWLRIYMWAFPITLLVLMGFMIYFKDTNIAGFVSATFIGFAGFIAVNTWTTTHIFTLKQARRNLTTQQMISHQESRIYQDSKLVLRKYFPDHINPLDPKTIPSFDDLRKEVDGKGDRVYSSQDIEAIENAMEGLLNAYENFAAAIYKGYMDHDFLKETIRGQVVRACITMSNFIKEAADKDSRNLIHLRNLNDVWKK